MTNLILSSLVILLLAGSFYFFISPFYDWKTTEDCRTSTIDELISENVNLKSKVRELEKRLKDHGIDTYVSPFAGLKYNSTPFLSSVHEADLHRKEILKQCRFQLPQDVEEWYRQHIDLLSIAADEIEKLQKSALPIDAVSADTTLKLLRDATKEQNHDRRQDKRECEECNLPRGQKTGPYCVSCDRINGA